MASYGGDALPPGEGDDFAFPDPHEWYVGGAFPKYGGDALPADRPRSPSRQGNHSVKPVGPVRRWIAHRSEGRSLGD